MSPDQASRRSILVAGAGIGGLSLVGATALFYGVDDDLPRSRGLTSGTVPAGSDPLVMAQIDRVQQSSVSRGVLGTLLRASEFSHLPDVLTQSLDTTASTSLDLAPVGTVLLVGSPLAEHAGSATVWANWTSDDLKALLETTGGRDVRSESYRDQTVYTSGEMSAFKPNDHTSLFGVPAVVRNHIDDFERIDGETLDLFTITPIPAQVRFSFESLGLPCDATTESRSTAYDDLTQVYGWVSESGDELRLRLHVDRDADRDEIERALRDDLDAADHDFGGKVTVERDSFFVGIRYAPESNDAATAVGAMFETVVCRCGLSSRETE